MNYLDVANSKTMFLLCLIPALTIVSVAVLFIRTAWKRGLELGMSNEKLKKCVTTSVTFSIVPFTAYSDGGLGAHHRKILSLDAHD